MRLVSLTPNHPDWPDLSAMRNTSAIMTVFANDPSLHHTCADNLSSLNGSKPAAV